MESNRSVLGISGTPRKGGNSEHLLDASLEAFVDAGWNVTRVLLSEKVIEPCVGCETCVETEVCCVDDDMSEVYRAFEKCDAVIISTPTYYRNVPAQLKALFDRTYAINDKLTGKYGGAIAVGRGSSSGGQCIALTIVNNFYLSNGMLPIPGELNSVAATADKPGDILTQQHRLQQARFLGENIIKQVCK